MKIGLIIYDDLQPRSGGYLYDQKLVEYLNKKGDCVEIISIHRKEYMEDIQQGFSLELYNNIRKLKLDLLLQDELCHPSLFLINEKLKKDKCPPFFSIVHNLNFLMYLPGQKNDLIKYYERRYLETIDNFVFVNNNTKDEVEKLLKHRVSSVIALPGKNHVTPKEPKKKIYKQNDILKIIFIGNLYPNKGLDILVKAVSQIEKNRWILTVVGDIRINKEYTSKIKKLIRKLGLDENIFLKGFVSHDKIHVYFENNHLFVLPSYSEGLSIACIEALGFGLPVIASNSGGINEIISPGKEGYLVKPGNITVLKEKINFIIKNPDSLYKMKINALDRYDQLPTWNDSMKKIWSYLHENH